MKKFISGFAVVAALLLSNVSSAVSIEDAYKFYAAEHTRETLLVVLSAYAEGMGWANTELESQGCAALYCQPGKLALTAQNIYRLTTDHIETADYEVDPDWPFEMLTLEALMEAFPCD